MPKLSTKEISDLLREAEEAWPRRRLMQHYKGGTYRIEGYAFDTETEAVSVRYKRVGGTDYNFAAEANVEFVRPLVQFGESVGELDRFTLLP